MTSLLVGKPNCGKSLLFNKLTGSEQKVSNYAGVTVQIKKGKTKNDRVIIDFPGVYSTNPTSPEESHSIVEFKQKITDPECTSVICVLDCLRLEASLVLAIQFSKIAKEHNKPIVFAFNMFDQVKKNKYQLNIEALEDDLGIPCIAISALKNTGLQELLKLVSDQELSSQNFWQNKKTEFHSSSSKQISKKIKSLIKDHGPNTKKIFSSQLKIDELLLSPIIGNIIFVLSMMFLFQAIFTWASPLMDLIESSIAYLSDVFTAPIKHTMLKAFFTDAIFGGVGAFLVFVPQIFFLCFIIGCLEDSGYLSRAAIICHKPLSWFGLNGKSFVPLLSGHACAIPAIISARTIQSPIKRLATQLVTPLIACSARLPVYALMIAAVVPNITYMKGLIGLQGFAFFMLYFLGIFSALLASLMITKFKSNTKTKELPFVMELTPYRWPSLKAQALKAAKQSWSFVKEAGLIIFVVSLVIWFLGYFPGGGEQLNSSYLAKIGQFIQPIFEPMNYDWKIVTALITSFLAREVFVSTLGTLNGIEHENSTESLISYIQGSGLNLATGISILIFFAFALQCASTLAVLKSETKIRFLPSVVFSIYCVIAYIMAFISYRICLIFV